MHRNIHAPLAETSTIAPQSPGNLTGTRKAWWNSHSPADYCNGNSRDASLDAEQQQAVSQSDHNCAGSDACREDEVRAWAARAFLTASDKIPSRRLDPARFKAPDPLLPLLAGSFPLPLGPAQSRALKVLRRFVKILVRHDLMYKIMRSAS